ncbi:hypothetical protein EDC01DRAFT_632616 [Geopyxis carbonaria]|nr:hypothetical protein EDC01DRAFT_632616 [Geopyxis carbonaria]
MAPASAADTGPNKCSAPIPHPLYIVLGSGLFTHYLFGLVFCSQIWCSEAPKPPGRVNFHAADVVHGATIISKTKTFVCITSTFQIMSKLSLFKNALRLFTTLSEQKQLNYTKLNPEKEHQVECKKKDQKPPAPNKS